MSDHQQEFYQEIWGILNKEKLDVIKAKMYKVWC